LLRCLHQEGAMRSKNSYRPQNLKPDGLVQSRKQVAEQHHQQVRVTVAAMLRRGMEPQEITVPAVAKEARVSVATIYRRADLFTLVQRANPAVQRRQAERVYQNTIQQFQEELKKAQADAEYYQKEAQMAKLGERRPRQEVTQLKKTILALQRQVACLEELLVHCTCHTQ
jgi:sulfur relay (sulfurtransferase) complex TusBCD TusD component (DsrE family)